MNHWRAACGESSQARFGGGPTEKDHLSVAPRWRPTRLGGGPTEKACTSRTSPAAYPTWSTSTRIAVSCRQPCWSDWWRHHNVAVVGDPLQSVCGFRGADPQLLVEFTRTFPGAQVVVLEENHRSTRAIVSLANALAAPLGQRPASWTSNPDGPPARLYVADDDEGEAQFIAGEVARLLARGELMQPGQAAVLFRTNAQARAFALTLRARGIPVRLRSEAGFFACPEVRDLVAYLRLAHSPHDSPALARIVNIPPRRLREVEHAFRKQPVPIGELAEWLTVGRARQPVQRSRGCSPSWTRSTRPRARAGPPRRWSWCWTGPATLPGSPRPIGGRAIRSTSRPFAPCSLLPRRPTWRPGWRACTWMRRKPPRPMIAPSRC
jgi:hypothetical protein